MQDLCTTRKNHVIKFVVDAEQHKRIQTGASAKGYKTISAYLRDLALKRDITLEQMIVEMHKALTRKSNPLACVGVAQQNSKYKSNSITS